MITNNLDQLRSEKVEAERKRDQAHPAACDCLQSPNCESHGMF